MTDAGTSMISTHDLRLVILSILIAIITSYTARIGSIWASNSSLRAGLEAVCYTDVRQLGLY